MDQEEPRNTSSLILGILFILLIVCGICIIIVFFFSKRIMNFFKRAPKEKKKKSSPPKRQEEEPSLVPRPREQPQAQPGEIEIDFNIERVAADPEQKIKIEENPESWTPESFGMKADGKFFVLRLFKDCNIQMTSTTCAICLGPFQPEEEIKQAMACRHIYHKICIDEWILHKMTCPLCNNEYDSDIDFQTFFTLEMTAK